MPVKLAYEQHQGELMRYYQWGDERKKYCYTPGNETASTRPTLTADKQREPAHASG